jgi:hypothetical protein
MSTYFELAEMLEDEISLLHRFRERFLFFFLFSLPSAEIPISLRHPRFLNRDIVVCTFGIASTSRAQGHIVLDLLRDEGVGLEPC